MKVTYDQKVDALYIELKPGAYDRTKKVTDDILVDVNKKGKVIGVEILDASRNIEQIDRPESQILWETLPSKPLPVGYIAG